MKKYDVIIIGAGPGGIFSAYELLENNENLEIAIFEEGHALEKRNVRLMAKDQKLHSLQELFDHERIRRCGSIFRW